MAIGENVARVREFKGLKQCELAELIGVKQSMVSQIERGTKALSVALAIKVMEVLECSFEDLIK